MKRSEMVNSIEILLESIGYVGPSDSGEKVMQLIEDEGMLPPDNMDLSLDSIEYKEFHTWEKEGKKQAPKDWVYEGSSI